MGHIFISYAVAESAQAHRVAEQLRGEELDVWIDDTNISGATQWSSEIANAIEHCSAFLILLSAAAYRSHNVLKEISLASEKKKPIIPVELERLDIPLEFQYQLIGIQRIAFGDSGKILEAVHNAIRSAASRRQIHPSPIARKRRLYGYVVLIVVLLAITTAAVFLFKKTDKPEPGEKTLAVLPFETLSSSKESEHFADGMIADLISILSHLQNIDVVDRATAMQFKGAAIGVKDIAEGLHVRYVLSGTVRFDSNHIKVTAELLDTKTSKTVFTEDFTAKFSDVLSLQEKLARRIAAELQANLQDLIMPTKDPEAYRRYLSITQSTHESIGDPKKTKMMIAAYDSILQLDPKFTQIYAAEAFLVMSDFNFTTHHVNELNRVDTLIRIMYSLDSTAINYALLQAQLSLYRGDTLAAIKWSKTQIERFPTSDVGYRNLAELYYRTGQLTLALHLYEEALKRNLASGLNWMNLLNILSESGDTKQLKSYAEQAISFYALRIKAFPNKYVYKAQQAQALFWAGRIKEANELAQSTSRLPNVDGMTYYLLAAMYANQANASETVSMLRSAKSKGWPVENSLETFDTLANAPEYKAFLKEINASTK